MILTDIKARCIEEGDCWIWQQGVDGHGRPQIRFNGKTSYTRRVARELADGKPVPESKRVPAECGNPLCVSPKCSLVASQKKVSRMASARGAFNNPSRILKMALTKRRQSEISDEIVKKVRSHPGPASAAALEAGISLSHAKAIRSGRSRKDYTNPLQGLMR